MNTLYLSILYIYLPNYQQLFFPMYPRHESTSSLDILKSLLSEEPYLLDLTEL